MIRQSTKSLILFICLLSISSVKAQLIDPPEPVVVETEEEETVPGFPTPQSCKEYIQKKYAFVDSYDHWLWFQRFALTYKKHSSGCDAVTGVCKAFYFTNFRGEPEGGGCDLVSTPFWLETQQLLADQLARLKEGRESLPGYFYAIECDYLKGQAPFDGECTLIKEDFK